MSHPPSIAALCAAIAVIVLVAPWWPSASRQVLGPSARRPHRRPVERSPHHPYSVLGRATTPSRLSRRHRERVLDQVVPDMLDLFVVSVHAGLGPAESLRRIIPAVHPLVGQALVEVDRRLRRGDRFADALEVIVDHLGTRLLTFVRTLAASERTGLPIGPALERIADDARLHRRHLVESEARELPVRLALPLVTCTLPAFALVAIAPLVIGAVSSLTAG